MNKSTTYSFFSLIAKELDALETELISSIQSPVPLVTEIGLHLMQAGGKRLRPALYLLSAKSRNTFSGSFVSIATAIEMIHMATLVHDDVIDKASVRRAKPTANSLWGNQISVLTGDCLFARAFSVIAEKGSNSMLKALTTVICSMCEGEIIQQIGCFDPEQSEEAYLERIAKKTADFIAVSCELGGMSAGLTEDDVMQLREYGYCIGMAFQITDDILDISADTQTLGKLAGSDLRQGIITLPVIYALHKSKHYNELRQIIRRRDVSEVNMERSLYIIKETNAIEESYGKVAAYLKKAKEVLPLSLSGEIRNALIEIAEFIGRRKY